ncbi:MAG TPA: TolC family protein [Gammaproteobacteria bacterium]|nr:TolC family protein [Gammaproteobacteria bacterium]
MNAYQLMSTGLLLVALPALGAIPAAVSPNRPGAALQPPGVERPAAGPPRTVHGEPLRVDPDLSLAAAVRAAVQREPRQGVVAAQRSEATALGRYGDSLIAGSPAVSLRHQNDALGTNGGLREWEAGLELPLWRPGQRGASQDLARAAARNADTRGRALNLDVAGRVREAVWEIELRKRDLVQARQALRTAEALTRDVQRRVELGDLPRQDRLLADNEVLARRTAALEAEAGLAHARRRYRSLTGLDRLPGHPAETLSPIREIRLDNPRLAHANAAVAQARAERERVRAAGAGSPTITLGTRHERDVNDTRYVDSVGLTLRWPIGTAAHTGPARAAAARGYAEAVADRDLLRRELAVNLHEANHALEVTRTALALAQREARLGTERLRLARIAFNTGELDLVEFLRVQDRAFMLQRAASIRAVERERAIARYNQTVGALP